MYVTVGIVTTAVTIPPSTPRQKPRGPPWYAPYAGIATIAPAAPTVPVTMYPTPRAVPVSTSRAGGVFISSSSACCCCSVSCIGPSPGGRAPPARAARRAARVLGRDLLLRLVGDRRPVLRVDALRARRRRHRAILRACVSPHSRIRESGRGARALDADARGGSPRAAGCAVRRAALVDGNGDLGEGAGAPRAAPGARRGTSPRCSCRAAVAILRADRTQSEPNRRARPSPSGRARSTCRPRPRGSRRRGRRRRRRRRRPRRRRPAGGTRGARVRRVARRRADEDAGVAVMRRRSDRRGTRACAATASPAARCSGPSRPRRRAGVREPAAVALADVEVALVVPARGVVEVLDLGAERLEREPERGRELDAQHLLDGREQRAPRATSPTSVGGGGSSQQQRERRISTSSFEPLPEWPSGEPTPARTNLPAAPSAAASARAARDERGREEALDDDEAAARSTRRARRVEQRRGRRRGRRRGQGRERGDRRRRARRPGRGGRASTTRRGTPARRRRRAVNRGVITRTDGSRGATSASPERRAGPCVHRCCRALEVRIAIRVCGTPLRC